MVFWDGTPSNSEKSWRFGGTYHLHLQGRKVSQEINQQKQAAGSFQFRRTLCVRSRWCVCVYVLIYWGLLADAICCLYCRCALYPRVCRNFVRGVKGKHMLHPTASPFRFLCMLHVSTSCSLIKFCSSGPK
jgi:hypothetical protein